MNGNDISKVRVNGNEIVRIRYNRFTLWEKYILKIRVDMTKSEDKSGEELIQFVLSKWFNEDFNYMLVKENHVETSTTLKVDLTIYSDEEPTKMDLGAAGFNTPVYTLLNIYNCKNVSKLSLGQLKNTELDIRHLKLDNITDLDALFHRCTNLASINVSGWDTSKVTDMNTIFNECSSLTSIDLSSWDTSSVTSTMSMFDGCTSLVSADLRNFDLSNCTSTICMFMSCDALTTLRLDNCSNDTINKIITSLLFPTFTDGSTHRIYCKQANAAGLTPPQGWTFTYVN
jgi:surface protein